MSHAILSQTLPVLKMAPIVSAATMPSAKRRQNWCECATTGLSGLTDLRELDGLCAVAAAVRQDTDCTEAIFLP